MSGIIEFYKIDKSKIIENLLPIISDTTLLPRETELKYVYDDSDKYIIGSFEKWVSLKNKETKNFETSYNIIIEKIKSDFFLLDHNEFEIMMNWLTWYYAFEFNNNDEFLDNLGFIEIGDLHSRNEATIFYVWGEYGINEFNEYLNKTTELWSDIETPCDSKKMQQVIDFLIYLLIKIIGDDYVLNIEEKDEDNILRLLKSDELRIKCSIFISSNFDENKLKWYKEEYKYLQECSESYLDKMLSFKKNIENYTGLIYRLDHD